MMNDDFAEHPTGDEMWEQALSAQGIERARALAQLAMHLYQRDDNEEAIALLEESQDQLELAGFYRESAACAHNAGVAAAELHRLDDAVTYHLRASTSYQHALREIDAARCLTHAADLEIRLRRLPSAARHFRQTARTFDGLKLPAEATPAWTAAGEAYRTLGQLRSARTCYRNAELR